MQQRILTKALNLLGRRYPRTFVFLEYQVSFIVTAVGCLIIKMYIDISWGEFFRIFAFAEIVMAITIVVVLVRVVSFLRPIRSWLAGDRSTAKTVEAWLSTIAVPANFLRKSVVVPFFTMALPIALYSYYELDFNTLEAATLFGAISVAIAYTLVLQYQALEWGMRPIVVRIAESMPDKLYGGPNLLPLRWKLMMSLPTISLATGLVVTQITPDEQSGILGLSLHEVVVLVVAAIIVVELAILLSKSMLVPVSELGRATQSVSRGDLDVRVPVTSRDAIGALARSFDESVEGIASRERLQAAFGSYVGTRVAEQVIEKGEMLKGEEVKLSVLFVDIRGFTTIASNSTPRKVVKLLNNFYECVVPVLHLHGGHANKFIGDGLLGVFGAPERHSDHADRALRAALGILTAVNDRFDGELEVGIGINSGKVIAGSIGGGGRLEFSVIGDTVNVASRIEEITRETGDRLLISAATYRLLNDSSVLEPRESIMLRGKDEPIDLYAMPVEIPVGATSD